MCAKRAVFAAVYAVAGLGAGAMAQPIAITDAGFEATSLSQCGFTGLFGAVSGWESVGGDCGVWRPAPCWDMTAPEGIQIAYSNGGQLMQVLGVHAVPGAAYQISALVGNRNHSCCAFREARLELWAGEGDNETPVGAYIIRQEQAPPRGGWTRFTGTITAPDNLPSGFPLVIKLRSLGSQVDFDAVTLERGGGCAADFNGDGFLDFFDYAEYVDCFETGVCAGRDADFNGDGFADFFDYADFVSAFEAGC